MSDNEKSKSGAEGGNGVDQQGPRRLGDGEDTAPGTDTALAEAKAAAEKFKNEYLYQRAEFENYKKQVIKERSDLRKYGCDRLVSDLLNVLDILDTALATEVNPENVANFRKGIEMTATEFRNVLQKHGVSEVPGQGQPFDPALYEALSSEETDAAAPGTITQVFKKAYKLHDRVVRPGQVVVARSKG